MASKQCCENYAEGMSLPEYHMIAGESKQFTIPIYDSYDRQIDATGMTARFAICGYINPNMEPFVTKPCTVMPWSGGLAVLYVVLKPEDTVDLTGKFFYQITAKDTAGDCGIMRGHLYIHPNGDKDAINL